MFGWSKNEREAKLRGKSLDAADSLQFYFFQHFERSYEQQYGDQSTIIAAGLSNFIFRFGDLGPKFAGNSSDSVLVMGALEEAFMHVQEDDRRQAMSAGVILAGAGQQIPLPKFREHLELLWRQALVDVGPITPDIRSYMATADYVYYAEAIQIQL